MKSQSWEPLTSTVYLLPHSSRELEKPDRHCQEIRLELSQGHCPWKQRELLSRPCQAKSFPCAAFCWTLPCDSPFWSLCCGLSWDRVPRYDPHYSMPLCSFTCCPRPGMAHTQPLPAHDPGKIQLLPQLPAQAPPSSLAHSFYPQQTSILPCCCGILNTHPS